MISIAKLIDRCKFLIKILGFPKYPINFISQSGKTQSHLVHSAYVALNFEKNITRAVCLQCFVDIPLNFEKNIAREVCLLHFTDIALNLEKNIVRAVCLLKFLDITLKFEKNIYCCIFEVEYS